MAIINSVGNLLGAVNAKADSATSVAKGILCIPSLLSQFPNIVAGIGSSLASSVTRQLGSIAAGLQNTIFDTFTNTLNQLTNTVSSALNTVLQIEAAILASYNLVIETIQGFKQRITDISDFISTRENCKYAAASLMKCVIGSVSQDVTKSLASKIQKGSITSFSAIESITSKLESSQGVIARYVQKTESSINKAASQIKATRLI